MHKNTTARYGFDGKEKRIESLLAAGYQDIDRKYQAAFLDA